VSVCPPRPFHWEQSFRDRWFSYWVNEDGPAYPSDEGLQHHLVDVGVGNVYLLASEVYLWKDWQLAFVPRQGLSELQRVVNTAHRLGARVVIYTSPFYFTRGTPHEKFATNSLPVHRCGPGWGTGENLSLFLPEIRKVVQDYGVDGLYFDNLYTESLVQSYRLVRETRKILGEERLLCVHSTWNPPGNNMEVYCPTLEAYADFQYRGEDVAVLATHTSYLRYVMSGYNISNCIGMPCHNKVPESDLNEKFIDAVLDVNGRFFFHGGLGWDRIKQYYWPQLNDSLKERVARVRAARNAAIQGEGEGREGKRREGEGKGEPQHP
jgi:hypothetical protein